MIKINMNAQTQSKSQPLGASIIIVKISLSTTSILSLQQFSPIIEDESNCQDIDPIFLKTRPEVSEGGPAITNLGQGVATEKADRHRQIAVSMDLPL